MKIVIALGGNALGKNLAEQMKAVRITAHAIADLIEDGHKVVISHGNGPQVGMIQKAFAAYRRSEPAADVMPLSMCVAMSQGYIGYDLQNVIGEELDRRGIGVHVATVLTQVAVDPADPAFQNPVKPVGAFMTEEEARKLAFETGAHVMEGRWPRLARGRGKPRPREIIEINTIRALMDGGHAVIAAGGGGIPVIWEDKYHWRVYPPSSTRTLPPSAWRNRSAPISSSSSPPWKRQPYASANPTRRGWESSRPGKRGAT
jgi:carbamate kinase